MKKLFDAVCALLLPSLILFSAYTLLTAPTEEELAEQRYHVVMVRHKLQVGESLRSVAAREFPNQKRYQDVGHWVSVVKKANGGENFTTGDCIYLPMTINK